MGRALRTARARVCANAKQAQATTRASPTDIVHVCVWRLLRVAPHNEQSNHRVQDLPLDRSKRTETGYSGPKGNVDAATLKRGKHTRDVYIGIPTLVYCKVLRYSDTQILMFTAGLCGPMAMSTACKLFTLAAAFSRMWVGLCGVQVQFALLFGTRVTDCE